jgi:hypothetical protein
MEMAESIASVLLACAFMCGVYTLARTDLECEWAKCC